MGAYTSIQIKPETREMLARLKQDPRETYDSVIRKLASLIPTGDEEGEYTHEFRVSLLNARIDLMTGKTTSLREVEKMLGL